MTSADATAQIIVLTAAVLLGAGIAIPPRDTAATGSEEGTK
jgi:hypothetical protein